MKGFQSHALNRMIQLFILKGQDIDETQKAVYVFNILLKILRVSANDRKVIITNDLLENLKVNPFRELCWKDNSNSLFIEIYTKAFYMPLDDAARQSSDS